MRSRVILDACVGMGWLFGVRDHLFHLNYAITLRNNGETAKAKKHLADFDVSSSETLCGVCVGP